MELKNSSKLTLSIPPIKELYVTDVDTHSVVNPLKKRSPELIGREPTPDDFSILKTEKGKLKRKNTIKKYVKEAIVLFYELWKGHCNSYQQFF